MDGSNGLPAGWKKVSLADIAALVRGVSFPKQAKTSTHKKGYLPCLRTTNVQKEVVWSDLWFIPKGYVKRQEQYVKEGDVLISTANSLQLVGKVAQAKSVAQEATIGAFISLIRPAAAMHSAFVYYQLTSSDYQEKIRSSASTTTNISNVSTAKLLNLDFVVPPGPEQTRIVDKVDELLTDLDAGVEELRKTQAQLKRYRHAVLKSAVTGKLTKEWRETHKDELEPASELLAHILKERRTTWEAEKVIRMKHKGKVSENDDWKNSYREPVKPKAEAPACLPLTWSWVTWDQIGFSQNGRLFPSGRYQLTGVKLLRPGNLHISGKVVWTSKNTRYMPSDWEQQFSEFLIRGEELIINLTAQSLRDEFLGRVCLTAPSETCLLNQRIARLMPIKVSRKYLFYVFKSEIFRRFVNTLNTGSLIQHMFTSQLSEFCLPLPSLEEQEQIVAEVERCLSIADAIEQSVDGSLAQADQMRACILKRAFEGSLVPQDPNDEPAELLLERIKVERATQEAEKQAKTKSNRKGFTKNRRKRTERPAA